MSIGPWYWRSALWSWPNLINQLLGQGFGIISWVVLWHPVEAFLYDPIPLRRENAALSYIATMDIVLEPQHD